MKWLKSGDLGTGLAIGLGAAILAPIVLPLAAAVVKPVLKGGIKAGLLVYEKGKVYVEEARENIEDLAAEAKSEMKEAEKAKLEAAGAKKPSTAKAGA